MAGRHKGIIILKDLLLKKDLVKNELFEKRKESEANERIQYVHLHVKKYENRAKTIVCITQG